MKGQLMATPSLVQIPLVKNIDSTQIPFAVFRSEKLALCFFYAYI